MDLLPVLLCSNVLMDTAKIVMASFFCSNEVIKDISVLHQKNDDMYKILFFVGFQSFDPYEVLSVDTYGEMNNQIC